MSVVIVGSLVHFVWQGALIGALAWIAMRIARTPQVRYVIGVAALAIMAATPVITAFSRVVPGTGFPVPSPPSSSGNTDMSLGRSTTPAPGNDDSVVTQHAVRTRAQDVPPGPLRTWNPERGTRDLTALLSKLSVSPSVSQKLFVAWLLGVSFLSLRLCVGWWTARRLTRVGVMEPSLEILSHAERLMGALRISGAVTVLESALVKVPMTRGWWKPVVLLPAAAMTGLSLEQIDALIAHELAHVRRHDYLVNLAQSAIETLLFYHPAVWLISRAVRHERELCCDDIAVDVCGGDTVTYASALADLEQMRVAEPALAANGGALLVRVKRILGHDARTVSASRTNWSAGIAIVATVLVLLPISAARPKATALLPGWEEVGAQINLGSGLASLLKNTALPGVVGIEGIEPRALKADPGTTAPATEPQSSAGQAAPADVPPVDYKILPLDILEMTVSSGGALQVDFNQPYGVSADGSIVVPLLGRVIVAGQTLSETSAQVRSAFVVHRLFTDPIVQITAKVYHRTLTASERAQLNTAPDSPDIRAVKAQVEYEDAYREALAGRWDSALNRFQAVLANYPEEAAADQAQFQIGEIYLNTQRATDALLAYSKYIDAHPRGWWIADAYYKRGKCYQAVQDVERAAADFRLLIRSYPNSTWVPLARAALAQLPAPKITPPPPGATRPSQLIDHAPSPTNPSDVLAVGDVLRVTVYSGGQSQDDFRSTDYVVMQNGAAALPLIPPVKVAGLAVAKANEAVTKALVDQGVYRDPTVDIVVVEYHSQVVKVQGAVRQQGNITLRANSANISDAIVQAGGLMPQAGRIIRVKRADTTRPTPAGADVMNGWEQYTLDPLNQGALTAITLDNGDTIDVPTAPQYFINGYVVNPGQYQWEPSLTLERAILKAGGATKDGATNRTSVKRLDQKTGESKDVDLGSDKMQFQIQPNDVIYVPKKRFELSQ